MLHLEAVSKAYPTKTLLSDVGWHVAPGTRWGLVGPNGAGKSTLMGLILGRQDADAGSVRLRPRLKVGYLEQSLLGDLGRTVQEECWQSYPELLALRDRIAALEASMRETHDPEETEALVHRHAEALADWERLDGYTADMRIGKVLSGLGFLDTDRARRVSDFSGGWQMRVALAKLLLTAPDLLLLDEPTNHLDLEAIGWLEGYLRDYPGSVVLVSHDRHFLDAVTTHTAFLEGGRLEAFTGAYSRALKLREAQRETQASAHARQTAEIERIQKFIDRFRAKATKASQVKSREKMLDKLERVEAPSQDGPTVRFRFAPAVLSGRIVLTLRDVEKTYVPGTPLVSVPRLELERGMRLALVGPNGAGKSTLLRVMAGIEPPDSGELTLGLRVLPGYFAQNQAETLDLGSTVLEEAYSVDPSVPLTRLRGILGSMLFTGEDAFKPVKTLSGGEKSRLALVKLLLAPHNLLLLDEPTNHLDLGSKDELGEALEHFDGTAVFVSHDRDFLDRAATHVLHLEAGKARLYVGNYTSYLEQRGKELGEAAEAAAAAKVAARAAEQAQAPQAARGGAPDKPKKLSYKQERALEAAEARVMELETKLSEIQAALGDPATYSDAELAKSLQQELDVTHDALEEANLQWLELAEAAS